jgi:undecaprenyl phosphate-alpha-L-ara4N flippase subunit ArnE
MTGWLWIALAAGLNSGALILMRFAGREMHGSAAFFSISLTSAGWLAGSLLAYGLAFLLTIRILAVQHFGVAVPLFVGLQFVFSLMAARWVFHEAVNFLQLAGVMLILAGAALISWRD